MIGVGILSYNRFNSIKRLVDSIVRHSDLGSVNIVISDDCSQSQELLDWYSTIPIKVLKNKQRAGIAGNSNRCLKYLEGSEYILLMNDDVQVLSKGWEEFYPAAMKKTGLHHFCYREPGVYGARLGTPTYINNIKLRRVDQKPHGAVLAIDHTVVPRIGYFDECFGIYGVEHVDWSTRVFMSGLQTNGFFDVENSSSYFKLHPDTSAVEDRTTKLFEARKLYAKGNRPTYIESDITYDDSD